MTSNSTLDTGWMIVLAAARRAADLARAGAHATFASTPDGVLREVSEDARDAVVTWHPGFGWERRLASSDPRAAILDLYLPICSAHAGRPLTVGHLGQSLDGFIATHSGESRWVTGEENMRHMHRLRAICDAVIVGAGTVAADDPQLTTRLVEGSNPLRVILDPARRLRDDQRVFNDPAAETLYVCGQSLVRPGEERFGEATVVGVREAADGMVDLAEVIGLLRSRQCARIFIEGGGVTVSMFLQAKLLDRLHVAIAPLLIGDGRPAIRLQPPDALEDCHRPSYRVFRMGADVLFDCDLRAQSQSGSPESDRAITRVI